MAAHYTQYNTKYMLRNTMSINFYYTRNSSHSLGGSSCVIGKLVWSLRRQPLSYAHGRQKRKSGTGYIYQDIICMFSLKTRNTAWYLRDMKPEQFILSNTVAYLDHFWG